MDIKTFLKSYNYFLVISVIVLSIFGIIIIGSVAHTKPEVVAAFDKQKLFLLTGLILMFVTSLIDYKFIAKFYVPIYIFNILLLIVMLLMKGNATNEGAGVARWISIGPITLQPSEFSKLFFIIFIAKYVDKKNDKINNISVVLSIIALTLIPAYLINKQPSLSASLVTIAITASVLFVGNLNFAYFLSIIIAAVTGIGIFVYDLFYNNYKIFNFLISKNILKDYHLKRVISFIGRDPKDDYFRQTANSIFAIGSGGLNGKGLFNGVANKRGLIDNNQNDFIFSVIGEELGFSGSILVICLMILIIIICLYVAFKAETNLGKLMVAGIVGMFAFQAIVNICVATGLCPNTGMPFPFLSSGGSSMWVNMIAIGIVINIGVIKPKSIFEG